MTPQLRDRSCVQLKTAVNNLQRHQSICYIPCGVNQLESYIITDHHLSRSHTRIYIPPGRETLCGESLTPVVLPSRPGSSLEEKLPLTPSSPCEANSHLSPAAHSPPWKREEFRCPSQQPEAAAVCPEKSQASHGLVAHTPASIMAWSQQQQIQTAQQGLGGSGFSCFCFCFCCRCPADPAWEQ